MTVSSEVRRALYLNKKPPPRALSGRRERALVRRAAKGDSSAFGRLFSEYIDRVYAFVRSRIADEQEAEDVTSTVFLKAWEALPAFEDRGVPFAAWLFRIARNAVIDSYRRSGRDVEAPSEQMPEVEDENADPHESVLRSLEAEVVRVAVLRLTDEQASVVRFFWDMDVRETAAALGRTEGSVKALQHRAVRSLAKLIDGQAACDE